MVRKVPSESRDANSLNRYAYAEGNPATMTDPFGLCAQRSENIHYYLDLICFIPIIGDVVDAGNGIYYFYEGKCVEAGCSMLSVIPIAGDIIGKSGKYGYKGF